MPVLQLYAMQACHGHLVLLLLLLFFLDDVLAVCRHCWGTVSGCTGTATNDACPLITGVASNVGALAVGATTLLSVAALLPVYLQRVFTHRVLTQLASLARRGSAAVVFDYTGKSPDEVIQGVLDRQADADDAIGYLGITAATTNTAAAMRECCIAAIKVVEALRKGPSLGQGTRVEFGRFLYLFALCQQYVATTVGESLSLGDSSAESSTSSAAPKAHIRAPSSADVFYESLNLFVLVCHATGASSALIVTRFIHESVYHTRRVLGFSYMVAFELFVIYLEHVDVPQGPPVNLATVTAQGGLDTHLAQACINGARRFGASFREKGSSSPLDAHRRSGPGGPELKDVKGSTDPTAPICSTYNFCRDHKPSDLDEHGVCKRRHVCSHFVDNKGKLGRCEGSHPFPECKNSHGCTRAVADAIV